MYFYSSSKEYIMHVFVRMSASQYAPAARIIPSSVNKPFIQGTRLNCPLCITWKGFTGRNASGPTSIAGPNTSRGSIVQNCKASYGNYMLPT